MHVEKLWDARVTDYTYDVLARDHRYNHRIANRLRINNGVEDVWVLIVERTIAAWNQLGLSQISNGTVNHAPLDDFVYIPLSPGFAFLPPSLFLPCVAYVTFLGRFQFVPTALVVSRAVTFSAQRFEWNGFPFHRRLSCWACCQGASASAWWTYYGGAFSWPIFNAIIAAYLHCYCRSRATVL